MALLKAGGTARPTLAVLAAWLVLCPQVGAAQRTATAEDDIKATFLFNFTRFIEWPPSGPADAFQICTVAEPSFNAALERTLEGESAAGRPLVRVSPATPEAARSCQILFLSRQESVHADRWITAVRGAPVLIVGESSAVWERGGLINFVLDDNRVKFDVNEEAASRAGLTISSKLLHVARRVASRRSQ